MTKANWRIYYSDGSSFSSADGDMKDAPARDVQIIAQEDAQVGRFMQSGSDYYVYRDGCWWGVDIFGLFDFLMDSGVVKFGRTVSNDEFQEVYKRAKGDSGMSSKTALSPREKRV